jgi:hypothetical protein
LTKVCIIDIFSKRAKCLAINSFRKNASHGQITSAIFSKLSKADNVELTKFKVKPVADGRLYFDPKSLLKQLKKINSSGEHFDYLNISTVYHFPYLGVKPEDLANDDVKRQIYNKLPLKAKNVLNEIQKIVDNKTEVYVPAGNRDKQYNILSLVRGIHTVGSIDVFTHKPIENFSNNSAVDRVETLPLLVIPKKKSKKFVESVDIRTFINNQDDLAKLSFKELSAKRASKKDYVELEKCLNDAKETLGRNLNINDIQHSLERFLTPKLKHRIFKADKYYELLSKNINIKECPLKNAPDNLYCNYTYRQFFDLSKKNKCVLPLNKHADILNSFSGTCIATIKAFCRDINNKT